MRSGRLVKSVEAKLEKARARGEKLPTPATRESSAPPPSPAPSPAARLTSAKPPALERGKRGARRSSWCSHHGSCESEGPAGERSPRGPAGPAALWTGHGSRVGAGESRLWAPLAQSPGRCPASKAVGGQGPGHRLSPATCVDLPNKFHVVISLRQRRAILRRVAWRAYMAVVALLEVLSWGWVGRFLFCGHPGQEAGKMRRGEMLTVPDRGARCSSRGSLKNQQPATGYEELAPEFAEIPSAFLRCQRQVPCICSSNKVLFVDGLTGLQTQRWEANGETDQGPSSASGGSLDECLGR
ncbi:hypothetical protein AAY473_039925 [Plecturocebus cupreus]